MFLEERGIYANFYNDHFLHLGRWRSFGLPGRQHLFQPVCPQDFDFGIGSRAVGHSPGQPGPASMCDISKATYSSGKGLRTLSRGTQLHIGRGKVDTRKMPCVWRALGKVIYFKKEYCLQGVLIGFRGNVNFFFPGWNSYCNFLMVNHSFLNFYIKHFILLYWLNFYALLHFDSKEWPGNTLRKLETVLQLLAVEGSE